MKMAADILWIFKSRWLNRFEFGGYYVNKLASKKHSEDIIFLCIVYGYNFPEDSRELSSGCQNITHRDDSCDIFWAVIG